MTDPIDGEGRPPGARPLPVNEPPAPPGPPTVDLPTPSVALAVGAHPDDVEFGCGATLAKWAASGCAIHHLVLTDGAKGAWGREANPASLITLRQEEQRDAARRLGGGEVVFLGFPDGELRNGIREQWEVCRWIRTFRPDVVLTHDPWRRYRLHPDHRHAGFVVTDALAAARDPLFFTDQSLDPHRPRALLLWEADEANHVERVDGYTEAKVAALLAHRSQHTTSMGLAPEPAPEELVRFAAGIEAQLARHGALAGEGLGESFHLMTDL